MNRSQRESHSGGVHERQSAEMHDQSPKSCLAHVLELSFEQRHGRDVEDSDRVHVGGVAPLQNDVSARGL
jgi:hypothetical protein